MIHIIKNKVLDCATLPWSSIRNMEANSLKETKDRDVSKLKNAILKSGFNFPFFIWDGQEYILDGAGRVEALKALEREGFDIPDLPFVAIQAETLEEAKALVLQVSSQHGIISQESFQVFSEGLDLSTLEDMVSFPDIDFGKSVNFTVFESDQDPDDIPEPPQEVVSRLGDLYEIGGHRLLCGDSTLAENYSRLVGDLTPNLMVTDPPYGVEYDANWRNEASKTSSKIGHGRATGKVLNDDRADWRETWALFSGNIAYIWHAALFSGTVQESLEANGFNIRSQIIWAKNNFAIGRGDYHWKHEPCWYAVRKKGDWASDRKQSTLWEIEKPMKSETGHSTQKPVECMARPIRHHGKPGDYVYDPFGGSGTSMVAAQQEGRLCLMMELNPAYCDIIVARMQQYAPELLIKRNGEVI